MEFVCRLGTPDGDIVQEMHSSTSKEDLVDSLESRGYHVFDVKGRGLAASLGFSGRSSRRIKIQDFLIFNQELAALLKAGLPLLQSFDIMLERQKKPRLRAIFGDIRDRVSKGEELSEAFESYGEAFPPLYAASLRSGERSGELEQVLRRFVRYLKLVMVAQRKVVTALVYPSVLVVLSFGMLAVMGLYVIPRFETFYDGMDIQMPALTKFVLGTSIAARNNVHWIVLGVALLSFAFGRWRRTEAGKVAIDHTKLRIPIVGAVLHRFALSQFTRSLATLTSGGIPLVASLEIAVKAVGNAFMRKRLTPCTRAVLEGSSFNEALEKTGVCTDITIDMVKVGESTGELDEMLDEISGFLDQEIETRLERVLSLLEPLMLVVMGGLIAFLLVAMYLPMFSAWQQIQ